MEVVEPCAIELAEGEAVGKAGIGHEHIKLPERLYSALNERTPDMRLREIAERDFGMGTGGAEFVRDALAAGPVFQRVDEDGGSGSRRLRQIAAPVPLPEPATRKERVIWVLTNLSPG